MTDEEENSMEQGCAGGLPAIGLRLITSILLRVFSILPASDRESFVKTVIARRAADLPAGEALRFLFRLDAALYQLEGKKAVEYGGGTHTKHRHTGYHDFFVGRIRRGERVLDVGCGIGALAFDIADRSHAAVLGIDLDEKNIADARQRYAHPGVEYRVGDATRQLPEGPFDVVVLSNVLEHLSDRVEFLCRLKESAHPARLLIRVPLFERDWRVPLKRELGVEWRLDAGHEVEYSLESFADEMAAAGLSITHQEVRWGEIWAEAVPKDV
jgi:SAM-dependent methyltransferase